jgi:GT2 family glycosyltransferase
MTIPSFSVIICSIDPWKFVTCARHYESLLAGIPHEIIGIHDATSLAEGYNRGLAQSAGDIVIFSHDDVLILDDGFAAKISKRLADYDILGFTGASLLVDAGWVAAGQPFVHGAVAHAARKRLTVNVYGVDNWPVAGGIQAIDGLLMIARRQIAIATGFDAETFDGFHLYDLDFSFAAYLAGHKIGVCCDMPIIHASNGDFASDGFRRYATRFREKYAGRLAAGPAATGPKYKTVEFSDYRALTALWNAETLRRATIGLRRDADKQG